MQLLKPPEDWPRVGRHRCAPLATSYRALVTNAVAAGLFELYDARRVARLHGAPIWGGGFA
eukprot:1581071-Lingulodinium_polyedra.AAC.1